MKAELILRENFLQFPEGPRLDERGNLYFGDALETLDAVNIEQLRELVVFPPILVISWAKVSGLF